MEFNELTNEQRRQFIDARQVFSTYSEARRRWEHSFTGSMRWVRRKGHDYLHQKRRRQEKSLGPRSSDTEEIFAKFMDGRRTLQAELERLASRLDAMAPVNRALGLGRVPRLTARVVRRLDEVSLLGSQILIVGTNALFAYEARVGIHLSADILATNDADLLWDARLNLEVLAPSERKHSILKILQRVDRSFAAQRGDFRAQNADGFSVDLIRPDGENFVRGDGRIFIGDDRDDLQGAPIFGLQWLVNAPRLEEVVIGEDGYPVRFVVPDPRAFCLHKLWISSRTDRDPLKRPRDQAQASCIAEVIRRYLDLSFEDRDLQALPLKLRQLLAPGRESRTPVKEPKW